jgi:hypothetical protein
MDERMIPETDEVLNFFKALVDADRLKILGLLALEPRTVGQIAELLKLRPPLVLRHLDHLVELDLVKVEDRTVSLDTGSLEDLARRVLSQRQPKANLDDFEGEAYDRKILSDFLLPGGRLKDIPAQYKKRIVILNHIAQAFEPGVRYPEKQVNELLRRFHDDNASLRRYLVDEGMLERQGGEYWLR